MAVEQVGVDRITVTPNPIILMLHFQAYENGEIKRAGVWKFSYDSGSLFVDHVFLADEFDCFADWLFLHDRMWYQNWSIFLPQKQMHSSVSDQRERCSFF